MLYLKTTPVNKHRKQFCSSTASFLRRWWLHSYWIKQIWKQNRGCILFTITQTKIVLDKKWNYRQFYKFRSTLFSNSGFHLFKSEQWNGWGWKRPLGGHHVQPPCSSWVSQTKLPSGPSVPVFDHTNWLLIRQDS